ncbi:hypothetical protein H4R34_000195 [Dimargaris verticillata]|uniref:Transmembrane protein 135 N-terminal domain-containing protein n=1 Tax=Dimargaris verticillata TaxID=2761393 RepID=A0A9W8EEW6_9FUNG|nr:hypothetical protein H4R34_000195 [Dimargaris verticillata]
MAASAGLTTSWSEFVLENFLEVAARLTSRALTDHETELIVRHFRSFHERIKRASQQNLTRLTTGSPPSELRPRTPQLPATNGDALAYFTPLSARTPARCRHTGKSCAQNALRGFAKSFAVSYGLNCAFHLGTAALSRDLFRRPGAVRRAATRDSLTLALFLSGLIGGYKGILCLLRRALARLGYSVAHIQALDGRLAFLAGTVAGLVSIKLDRNKSRRVAIALYVLTRSAQFGALWLMKQWRLSRKARAAAASVPCEETPLATTSPPRQLVVEATLDRWLTRVATPVTYSLAAMVVAYAILVYPRAYTAPYYKFITTYVGFETMYGRLGKRIFSHYSRYVRSLFGLEIPSSGPMDIPTLIPTGMSSRDFMAAHLDPEFAERLIPAGVHHSYFLCALEHPETPSCAWAHLKRFVVIFPRIMAVYAPLNLAMSVVFNPRAIAKSPLRWLDRFVRSVVRSSLFLNICLTWAVAATCFFRRAVFKSEHHAAYLLNGFTSGWSIFAEYPGRRVELAMYAALRAVELVWNIGCQERWWRPRRHGEALYFALSTGVLMALYQQSPDVIRDSYRSVMTRLFGTN